MNSSLPDRRQIAHHEAGHAVIAGLYASRVTAEIGRNGHTLGRVYHDLVGAPSWQQIAIQIAGPMAEAIHQQHAGPGEPGGAVAIPADLVASNGAGAGLVIDVEPVYTAESLASIEGGARRRSIEARTLRLLRRHWPAVEAIAQALEAHGALTAAQVDDIFNQHGLQRPGW